MVRPERFELPTAWFVARYSIQLSYGRAKRVIITICSLRCQPEAVAEREGFEPSMELLTPYSLSRGAPSTGSAISPKAAQDTRFAGPAQSIQRSSTTSVAGPTRSCWMRS